MNGREWELKAEEFLARLGLDAADFEKGLCLPNVKTVKTILPLRNIRSVEALVPISMQLLLHMLQKIQTLDGKRPFKKSKIRLVKIDPHHLKIGQKFVYRENYQTLLEEVPDIFNRFCISAGGLGDIGAYFIFGDDDQGSYSMACYLPPLIERHGPDLVIMDGIHRNYIAKQAGVTINAIMIDGVSVQFPCATKDWQEIKVISLVNKPKDINERYFDLAKNLFRDLKHFGIDG